MNYHKLERKAPSYSNSTQKMNKQMKLAHMNLKAFQRLFLFFALIFSVTPAPAHEKHPENLFNQACDLYRKGKYEDSIKKCKAAVGYEPRGDAFYLMGLGFQKQGNHSEAIKSFERANSRPPLRHAVEKDMVHFALGNSQMALGNMEAAIESYLVAVKADSRQPQYWEALAAAYEKAGNQTEAEAAKKTEKPKRRSTTKR